MHTFKLVRRKGDEIVMAAETKNELERWMKVLQREMAKQRLSEGRRSLISRHKPSLVKAYTLYPCIKTDRVFGEHIPNVSERRLIVILEIQNGCL